MNPYDVAPMVAFVTLTVVTGAVLVLRPLSKRIGDLIQLMIEERRGSAKKPQPAVDTERIMDVLEGIETRLSRLEEKQTFTDAMLSEDRSRRGRITGEAVEPGRPADHAVSPRAGA